jgi:hypothetical protein
MELDRQFRWAGKVTREVAWSRLAASLLMHAYELLVPAVAELGTKGDERSALVESNSCRPRLVCKGGQL